MDQPRFKFFRSLGSGILLTLILTSVYAPFLGQRLVRMAGDEKVYVSQALEMERDGHWFVQTLQNVPDYYKGPMHYLLLRAGMLIFGHSPWATLYMNYALLVLGAISLAAIVRRRLPFWRGGDVWTGAAFGLGMGIYAHAWASQMEVEVACFYAIALNLLDTAELGGTALSFWIVTGLIGWIKSPLHSFLLGMSAVVFWTFQGEILRRLISLRAWFGAIVGILVCLAGYAPAFLLDRKNFWDIYIVRETLSKGASGQHWSVTLISVFSYYLFPWALVAAVAYLQFLFQSPRILLSKGIPPGIRRVLFLGVAGFLPSVIFFLWHPYHFENYNLPVISGIWLSLAAIMAVPKKARIWDTLYSIALGLTAVVFLALPIAVTMIASHFYPLPAWWPDWLVPVVWIGSLFSILGFLIFGAFAKDKSLKLLAITSAGILWATGALFSVLGEREMWDLRQFLAQSHEHEIHLSYDNVVQNIWSEWGYLNFWLNKPVRGLHTESELRAAIKNGDVILVSTKMDDVDNFKKFVAKEFPQTQFRYHPWHRWKTHGSTVDGKPLWREAWDHKNLSLLETDYLIVETAP